MKIFSLYIKAPHEDQWRLFTKGNHTHIDMQIRFITQKYPHHSYKTVLEGGE